VVEVVVGEVVVVVVSMKVGVMGVPLSYLVGVYFINYGSSGMSSSMKVCECIYRVRRRINIYFI
jgi:ABC-type phosphate transport system permease subunit